MKRQFFKHGVVYAGANLISGLSTILLVPVYTRALQPSEYGVVDYVIVLQSLVQICAGLEITQGIARYYAGADTDAERRAYASTGLWFLLTSFAAVCILLYLVARGAGAGFLGLGQEPWLVGLALASVYTRILFYALQSQARWELRADLYALASFVVAACTVGGVAYLLLVERLGVAGVFAGLSAGYAIGCVLCLVGLRHTYRPAFDARKFRQLLAFSLPLTFSSLALFFASYGDRLLVKSSLGLHDLGIYGIGARVAAVITLVVNGFQLGAAPLVYRHHGDVETPAALAQLLRLFLAAGLLGVAALAAFSIELLRVFTTPEYAPAWRLVPVLALAIVVANLYVFVPGLTIRNMTTRFALANIATAVMTLGLIAALLPLLGVLGASIGVLCGALAGFALHAALSQQVYAIPIEWGRLLAGFAIAASCIAVTWAVGSPGPLSLGLRLAVFLGAAAGLVHVLSTSEERTFVQRLVWSRAATLWSAA